MAGSQHDDRLGLVASYEIPDFAPDYWKEAVGGAWRPLAGIGRRCGTHPATVQRVLAKARDACPEAADVIVALVHDASVASEAWRLLSEQVKELEIDRCEVEDENARLRRAIEEIALGYRGAFAAGLVQKMEHDDEGDGCLADIVRRHLLPAGRTAMRSAELPLTDTAEGT